MSVTVSEASENDQFENHWDVWVDNQDCSSKELFKFCHANKEKNQALCRRHKIFERCTETWKNNQAEFCKPGVDDFRALLTQTNPLDYGAHADYLNALHPSICIYVLQNYLDDSFRKREAVEALVGRANHVVNISERLETVNIEPILAKSFNRIFTEGLSARRILQFYFGNTALEQFPSLHAEFVTHLFQLYLSDEDMIDVADQFMWAVSRDEEGIYELLKNGSAFCTDVEVKKTFASRLFLELTSRNLDPAVFDILRFVDFTDEEIEREKELFLRGAAIKFDTLVSRVRRNA
jgi:hypothetical protein